VFELLGSTAVRKLGADPPGGTRVDLGKVALALFPSILSNLDEPAITSSGSSTFAQDKGGVQNHGHYVIGRTAYQVGHGFDYPHICESLRIVLRRFCFGW